MRSETNGNAVPLAGRCMQSLLKRRLRQLRYSVRDVLVKHAVVYFPLACWKHGSSANTVGKNTKIVIEGFPRSGNSFAVNAFRLAQSQPVDIAHHRHAPAQVITAVKMNIPTLVLVRDPEEAILSLVIREPHLTIGQTLKSYLRFYVPILPYQESFVVGTFDSVTTEFGAVIRKVNNRFGVNFEEFCHTEENVKKCFALIEERHRKMNQERYGNEQILETSVARPSEERRKIKEQLCDQFHARNLREVRTQVRRIYETFLSLAES